MIELPSEIYTCAQVRELDRRAIDNYGIPSYELMTRAGQAALESVQARWPDVRTLTILCGAGNNAGDGYVVARLATRMGYAVTVLSLVTAERLAGDARRAYDDFMSAGGAVQAYQPGQPLDGVVVDALLGTGLTRSLSGTFADAVAHINACGCPVLALDIPSGLDADTGQPHGIAVEAHATITFVGLKLGLFVGRGADYRGALDFADLDVPGGARAELDAPARRLDDGAIPRALAPRRATNHKGDHGRLLLIGGAPGTAGAIRLAAEAALRAGAGLVRVATHRDSVPIVTAGCPEVMSHVVDDPVALAPLLSVSDALVIGPGLGTSAWARALWRAGLDAGLPLVLDADGLNLLARAAEARDGWILTPHPGEAGRLLNTETQSIQRDRLKAVRDLRARYGGVAILKGAGSLVDGPDDRPISVCDRGNPGMATAGMGDVLSGVLGALLVQGADLRSAADAGVLVHASAGDDAALDGQRGLIAGDLLAFIRRRVNPA